MPERTWDLWQNCSSLGWYFPTKAMIDWSYDEISFITPNIPLCKYVCTEVALMHVGALLLRGCSSSQTSGLYRRRGNNFSLQSLCLISWNSYPWQNKIAMWYPDSTSVCDDVTSPAFLDDFASYIFALQRYRPIKISTCKFLRLIHGG